MRITAGKYKGRYVQTVKTFDVRPTSSKIRESIFNILQSRVSDALMLDLFAGSGIMGMEALSRDTRHVVFVEKSSKVFQLLKKNLSNFDEADYELFLTDALKALDKLKGRKFNIIFVDPPYALDIIPDLLEKITSNELLAEDGIIIIEHSSNFKVNVSGFETVKTRLYGDTGLTFLTV